MELEKRAVFGKNSEKQNVGKHNLEGIKGEKRGYMVPEIRVWEILTSY